VLVTGETGSGKEIARTITNPLIVIQGADRYQLRGAAENLVESELFGLRKGCVQRRRLLQAGFV